MLDLRGILGACAVLLCLLAPARADAPEAALRPVARPVTLPAVPSERISTRAVLPTSAFTGPRPAARPLAMVRYPVTVGSGFALRPALRQPLPEAAWDHRPDAEDWTRATLAAINAQRHDLSDLVPRDVGQWCPAYARNPEPLRDAFWVGVISALAREESTFDPEAVGGGGQWFGLMQIYPPTARHFGCAARSGAALTDPEENLACAARIMAVTVRRDGAVGLHDGRWRGIAADWGPMTEARKRAEIMAFTRAQDYCALPTAVSRAPRPPSRPWDAAARGADPVLAALSRG